MCSKLNEQGIPVFHGLRIMSDSMPTTCGHEFYSLVHECKGENFHEAHENMKRIVNESGWFNWAKALMSPEAQLNMMRKEGDGICLACNLKKEPVVATVMTVTIEDRNPQPKKYVDEVFTLESYTEALHLQDVLEGAGLFVTVMDHDRIEFTVRATSFPQ
jgi:hypothetical protein